MKLVKFCEIVEICQTVCGECVECCLFTPWESNLFVTHNQYPAKNHHLRQNHRFTQLLKKILSKIPSVVKIQDICIGFLTTNMFCCQSYKKQNLKATLPGKSVH